MGSCDSYRVSPFCGLLARDGASCRAAARRRSRSTGAPGRAAAAAWSAPARAAVARGAAAHGTAPRGLPSSAGWTSAGIPLKYKGFR